MSKRPYLAWLLLLAVALAVRLAAAGWWHTRLEGRFGFGDSDSYWLLARSLAQGGPYLYADNPAFRMPGYPTLLAPFFLLSGDGTPVFAARLLSVVFGVATVVAVGWLGRTLFDARVGWLAAAMAAVYPGHVFLSVLVLSEAPFCLAMVVGLTLWAKKVSGTFFGQKRFLTPFCAGVAMGVATLIRPSWLLFPLVAMAVQIAIGRRWRDLQIAVIAVVGHVAILAPWWVRNELVVGHFVPTTLQVGASLYDGLHPGATGASDMTPVARREAEIRLELRQAGVVGQAEVAYQIDRQLRQEAFRWAWESPGALARLAGVKMARLWNIWPNEERLSSWPMRLGVVFTYIPIVVLGIMGAWRTRRLGPAWWLVWIPAGYLTLVHVVFVSSLRYREPAMLCVMVLAAAALVARKCEDTGP